MRLTLRTMLAYMDDILEPEDADLISKKIEQSELATKLLHRTRDVMRRLRLGTPEVTDRRAGLDANTVAEYLDNTLANDRVLDFEKVCLESDVHLAEVASCHQILALVLGEPVEVGVASRQRMYQLPELVSARVQAATRSGALPPVEPAFESPMGADDEFSMEDLRPRGGGFGLAEWLRGGTPRQRRWRRAAAIAGAALVGLVFLLWVTGQFRRDVPSVAGAGDPSQMERESPGGPASGIGAAKPEGPIDAGSFGAKREGTGRPSAEGPGQAGELPGTREATPTPSRQSPLGDPTRPAVGPIQPIPEQVAPIPGQTAEDLPPEEPTGPESEGPSKPALAQPKDVMEGPEASDRPGGKAGDPIGDEAAKQAPVGPAPLPPEPVGQLVSPRQVLLTFNDEAGAWERMPDEAPIMSETRYLCLPIYRPQIRLGDQTQLVLNDGTVIYFLGPDEQGVAGLAVEYGRLIVEGPDKAAARLRLRVGDRSGWVAFGDAGSRLAIEVGRVAGSNVDPETQPAPLATDLYAVSGKILWQEGADRQPLAVSAPVRLRLNQEPIEAIAMQTVPSWIEADTTKLLDRRASETMERELEVGRPVALRLRELAEHRQREVRWLAVRCLGWIEDFELTVTALDNPDERSLWRDYVQELRSAVTRGPRVAAQVRTAMERLHGDEGARLYEMLWKCGAEPLGKEEADELVGYLEHDTLAFRRLGFWDLQQGTGGPDLFYRPEDTAAKRYPAVRKWKQWLRSNLGSRAEPAEQKEQPSPSEDSGGNGILDSAVK